MVGQTDALTTCDADCFTYPGVTYTEEKPKHKLEHMSITIYPAKNGYIITLYYTGGSYKWVAVGDKDMLVKVQLAVAHIYNLLEE
jgi:hypothetical protein